MKWQKVKIFNCVTKVETCNPAKVIGENTFQYVDISSVNGLFKILTGNQLVKGVEAPSRARQILKEGDIVVSTVRPNLNAVAHVVQKYSDAIASTGFCVLRPSLDKINSRYLFNWVKSNAFVNDMVSKATGASYPAVSDSIIKDSLIPLPPLHIQEQIANTLDKADALRRKDQELLNKYDELAQAIFYEMFGDPILNNKNWNIVRLPDLSIKYNQGVNTTTENVIYDESGIYPIVRAGDIADGFIDFSGTVFVDETNFKKIKDNVRPKKGDILYANIGARLGAGCLVETEVEFGIAWNVLRIQCREEINKHFILFVLNHPSSRRLVQSMSKSATVPFISGERLAKIPFIDPPKFMQERFQRIYLHLIKQKEKISGQRSMHLIETLSNKFFS